ncbi:MAG: acyl dehydratase [Pseudomonadota bacterium]
MDPARANALQAALGQSQLFETGDILPPFFHQLYFWTPEPPARLGRDGHPAVGQGVIPDMGLPRRMWAAGRLAFHAELKAGLQSERITECEKSVIKEGRSGPLGFVSLRHEIRQAGRLCVTEWQDLVYRADPSTTAPPLAPPTARVDEEEARLIRFDPTLLFRYSALTFNGHRIHYDVTYAKETEGYDGLVVHGPLLAHLMMQMATVSLGPLGGFSFRATAPLMDFETAILCRSGHDLWVRGPDGRQCMIAAAQPL